MKLMRWKRGPMVEYWKLSPVLERLPGAKGRGTGRWVLAFAFCVTAFWWKVNEKINWKLGLQVGLELAPHRKVMGNMVQAKINVLGGPNQWGFLLWLSQLCFFFQVWSGCWMSPNCQLLPCSLPNCDCPVCCKVWQSTEAVKFMSESARVNNKQTV